MTEIKEFSFEDSILEIKQFPIDKMAEHCSIAIIGKRASGKTCLTRKILNYKQNIPTTIISKNEKLNNYYDDYSHESYDTFETDILKNIYQKQDKIKFDNEIRNKEGKKLEDDRHMIIMDDCMSSKEDILKNSQIIELFFNGRCRKISFILTTTVDVDITPSLRCNFDYVFLLADDSSDNIKKLYEHYAGMFPNVQVFEQVFSEITKNYGVMVIDNTVHSKNSTDKIFWFI